MQNISHRLVHLDLKGAPWKVLYLKEVIRVAKIWGATGILLEWEDSFPYTGHLANIGSLGGSSRDELYSRDEVQQILQFIEENGLEPIQLLQSIGHLEFVLKHAEFASLRELPSSPAVLCPTRPGSQRLVLDMIRQLLASQPHANYIHIGADEAWHMNRCDACTSKTSLNPITSVDSLFLDHIIGLVAAVHDTFPNVKVLIWDDMLRGMHERSIIDSELHKYVTPVVWQYGPVGRFTLDEQMWEKYQKAFSEVWIAPSFKGANGGNQIAPCEDLYASNQEAWIDQLRRLEAGTLKVTGVILTGWSRFDHYATLCELLPVSLPSLANCLKIWTTPGGVTKDALSATLPRDMWPGADCALTIHSVYACRQRCLAFIHGDAVGTWLTLWQVSNAYTNPLQVSTIAVTAAQLLRELELLHFDMNQHLRALTGPRSTEEWVQTNIDYIASTIKNIALTAEARANLPASVVPLPTESSGNV